MGVVFSIIAGIFITLQSVFNTKVSEKVGLLETTTLVHGIGFIFAMTLLFFHGKGGLPKIGEVNKFYLLGGLFGVLIVFSVMVSIERLGVTYTTTLLLITQLIGGLMIDTFGLFGIEKVPLTITKPLGLLIILFGIIIFKMA